MNKKAFTLAEVLITLGIIGVIAALTIPTLINKYQKKQYVTSLQKAYTIWTQGIKTYMAMQNATELRNTDLFDGTSFNSAGRQNIIDNFAKKTFKTAKICKYSDSSCQLNYTRLSAAGTDAFFNSTNYNFYTIDGIGFSLNLNQQCSPDYATPGPMKENCGRLDIDVNGKKLPNKNGRDFFKFAISHDGNIYPEYGIAYAKQSVGDESYEGEGEYWRDETTKCGILGSSDTTGSYGEGCSARIIEEGWEMNY